MGCPAEVDIGDNLIFSICTHDPDTGVLTDADAAPTYRVYEDETATAILTGTMDKLDDANTTGFYTEQIACTAANGFEDGKTYTIYIQATVDGDTGGISYGFRAMTPVWSASSRTLTQSAASITSTVSGSDLTIKRGDSLSASITGLGSISGRTKLWFTVKEDKRQADTSAIIHIEETDGLVYLNGASGTASNGTITVDDESDGDITITLDEVETAKLAIHKDIFYDVQVLLGGNVTTLTEGSCDISADVTRAIV